VAPEWMGCESFDLARIPYFNQDLEDQGNPDPVKELREKIRAYEAVLIATPEYDYAIPGVLTAATPEASPSDPPRPSSSPSSSGAL
jgi:chromate reductase, NAD(P)H dehydrogenase (quinone)